ncbi:hypothetical protein L1S35_05190 [Flavobacterium sp. AS60]|uniref:hypothetical protein n=1 Tax=Flavobacterium anseongense TaxID=2910677 RepID=UPI001F3F2F25|nr:hypothetical protein [Flavobacterium sp. AS60]MCF6129059.1 hypothetical protein [Flavobacterium sp. AS60]
MKVEKLLGSFLFMMTLSLSYGQKEKINSDTREFIANAEMTQINRNWDVNADFKSGIGEIVYFFPIEVIDLKSNQKVKSLQMDMSVLAENNRNYFKSSWIDLSEVDEFIYFIEQYVIPNLKNKTEVNQSVTYIFNSKEITLSFLIEKSRKRISIYLKDNGITDYQHYFWTETQVNKIPDLLAVLKQIK